MKTVLRNFFHTLLRFKAATLLNILGLTVAFASFMIILMQVHQQMTFDTCYPTTASLYQVERSWSPGGTYGRTLSRPQAEELFTLSPNIRKGAFRNGATKQVAYDPRQGTASAIMEQAFRASDDFPEVFGLEALSGSFGNFKAENKAIVSASTARRIFGREDPVGQTLITRDGWGSDTAEVVAVYQDLPQNASLENCIIKNIGKENLANWENQNYNVYLLVDTPEQARTVSEIASKKATERMNPEEVTEGHLYIPLTHLPDRYFSPRNSDHKKGNRTTLYSLMAVAVLIILVAMINFINFSMALVPRRIRNINTRKVLGSSLWTLRFQQLFEALGVTLIALGLGLLIVHILAGTSFAGLLGADIHPGANLSIIWLTTGIACLTGILSAVYPALYSTSFSPALVLKGSFGLSAQGRRLRTVLIGFQYVISLVLIIVALSIWSQYEYMRTYDIGLARENILVTQLTAPMAKQQEALSNRLKENPRVTDVAYAWSPVVNPPMSWGRNYNDENISFICIPVSYNFPSLMGISMAEGRDFVRDDEQKNGTFIFNETAQKRYNLEVGRRLDNHNAEKNEGEIVGIARDFNFRPLHYPIGAIAFVVFGHNPWGKLTTCYLTVNGPDVLNTIGEIRRTMLEFDPDAQSTLQIDFFDASIGDMYKKENHQAAQITLFSLLAVLISTVGAFGLIMFETQYRRKEIGLRKVFGATVGDVLRMFNKRYITIVGICFLFAAPAAYYIASQWQNNFTYKAPVTTWIFLAALLIVLLITVTTVTLQSYKSATENPADSVKAE